MKRSLMKNKLKIISPLVFVFAMFITCVGEQKQSQVTYKNLPGTTRAGILLQQDTSRNLFMQEMIFNKKKSANQKPCMELRILNTENISGPENATRKSWENWKERWTVGGCGITNIYNVNFVPDGSGGTFIKASKILRKK